MRRILALVAAAALAIGGCSGAGDGDGPGNANGTGNESVATVPITPARPSPVGIAIAGLPAETVSIGVLVAPIEGEGSEYRAVAEGAAIAAYRLSLAGADIEIVAALDDGTSAGADAAMATLIDSRVVGVVVASSGPHLSAALDQAVTAGLPVVMAYDRPAADASGIWTIAPTTAALEDGIADALSRAGARNPQYVTGSVTALPVPAGFGTLALADPQAAATSIVAGLEELRIDSVVIDAPAAQQAQLLAAVQSELADRQVPIILTPSALTPAFASEMMALGTSGVWLMSVGTNTGDPAALAGGESGDAVAGFLAAVRLASGDPSCRNIYDDDTCGATSTRGDAASHDAVLAVAHAVASAQSTGRADVMEALSGLTLTADHGLAGPPLDFSETDALAAADVHVLHATNQDPGLRPAGTDLGFFWFAGTE